MSQLKGRIEKLEGAIKIIEPPRMAVDVVEGYREMCAPHEVPEPMPGELFDDWLKRVSPESMKAILDFRDRLPGGRNQTPLNGWRCDAGDTAEPTNWRAV